MLENLAVAEFVFKAVALCLLLYAALSTARYTGTSPMLLQNTGATVLFPQPLLVLDAKEPLILIFIIF